MRPYHLVHTVAVAAVLLGATAAPGVAATRVAPKAGALYLGTATEDGAPAGGVSVRVGPDGASLISLLGGSFHGDLCTSPDPLFAGPGGINPLVVTLAPDGKFSGTQVTAGPDGSRIAGSLRGVFAPSATTASARTLHCHRCGGVATAGLGGAAAASSNSGAMKRYPRPVIV